MLYSFGIQSRSQWSVLSSSVLEAWCSNTQFSSKWSSLASLFTEDLHCCGLVKGAEGILFLWWPYTVFVFVFFRGGSGERELFCFSWNYGIWSYVLPFMPIISHPEHLFSYSLDFLFPVLYYLFFISPFQISCLLDNCVSLVIWNKIDFNIA